MGKFDAIDIVFISLISFYLLIFSLIFILLIRKHHGIRGLFRYLLDKNSITITNSGEVIEHIEEDKAEEDNKIKQEDNKDNKLSTKNKVTIKQFFEKRIKSLKKDIAKDIAEELKNTDNKDVKEVLEELTDTKLTTTTNKPKSTSSKKKSSGSKKKSSTAAKKSTTKKRTTTTRSKTTTKKKTTGTKKKTSTTKKTNNNNKKTTSKKK